MKTSFRHGTLKFAVCYMRQTVLINIYSDLMMSFFEINVENKTIIDSLTFVVSFSYSRGKKLAGNH